MNASSVNQEETIWSTGPIQLDATLPHAYTSYTVSVRARSRLADDQSQNLWSQPTNITFSTPPERK